MYGCYMESKKAARSPGGVAGNFHASNIILPVAITCRALPCVMTPHVTPVSTCGTYPPGQPRTCTSLSRARARSLSLSLKAYRAPAVVLSPNSTLLRITSSVCADNADNGPLPMTSCTLTMDAIHIADGRHAH